MSLPAGTTFFYGSLYTQAVAEVTESAAAGQVVYTGGSAYSDFSHTLNFNIAVPSNVTATSSSGLLPINADVSSPEPCTMALLMGSTGLLLPTIVL